MYLSPLLNDEQDFDEFFRAANTKVAPFFVAAEKID